MGRKKREQRARYISYKTASHCGRIFDSVVVMSKSCGTVQFLFGKQDSDGTNANVAV